MAKRKHNHNRSRKFGKDQGINKKYDHAPKVKDSEFMSRSFKRMLASQNYAKELEEAKQAKKNKPLEEMPEVVEQPQEKIVEQEIGESVAMYKQRMRELMVHKKADKIKALKPLKEKKKNFLAQKKLEKKTGKNKRLKKEVMKMVDGDDDDLGAEHIEFGEVSEAPPNFDPKFGVATKNKKLLFLKK